MSARHPYALDRIGFYGFGKADISSLFISGLIFVTTLSGFLLFNSSLVHWFVIPVLMCGILIGVDAVDWLRGRLDPFDLCGILGLLGVHFFFLAPLLHVDWNVWMRGVVPPDDWREWVGYVSIINFAGIVMYRLGRSLILRKKQKPRKVWVMKTGSFKLVWIFFLIFSLSLQVFVYFQHGGINGYINDYMKGGDAFNGSGYLFMFSECFPIIMVIGFALLMKQTTATRRLWLGIIVMLLLFVVLQLLFGGLRGSRSNTLWALFWAVGIIHYCIKPISRKAILVGMCLVFVFMYVYGFYKSGGIEGIDSFLQGQEVREKVSKSNGRTIENTLLGDLARSDIQAFVTYRLTNFRSEFDYAMGGTYLGAAALLVPKMIWSNKPPTKEVMGTELQYGRGSYSKGDFQSSKVYGLFGETAMNFGLFAVPFAFAAWGAFVGYIRRFQIEWRQTKDARIVLLPMLINLCFVILIGDSDNIVFFTFKSGLMPFLFILLSCKKIQS